MPMETRINNPVAKVLDMSFLDILLRPDDLVSRLNMPVYVSGRRIETNIEDVKKAVVTQVMIARRQKNWTWIREAAQEVFDNICQDDFWLKQHFTTPRGSRELPTDLLPCHRERRDILTDVLPCNRERRNTPTDESPCNRDRRDIPTDPPPHKKARRERADRQEHEDLAWSHRSLREREEDRHETLDLSPRSRSRSSGSSSYEERQSTYNVRKSSDELGSRNPSYSADRSLGELGTRNTSSYSASRPSGELGTRNTSSYSASRSSGELGTRNTSSYSASRSSGELGTRNTSPYSASRSSNVLKARIPSYSAGSLSEELGTRHSSYSKGGAPDQPQPKCLSLGSDKKSPHLTADQRETSCVSQNEDENSVLSKMRPEALHNYRLLIAYNIAYRQKRKTPDLGENTSFVKPSSFCSKAVPQSNVDLPNHRVTVLNRPNLHKDTSSNPQLKDDSSIGPKLQCNTSNRPELQCNTSNRPQLIGSTSNRPQLQCNQPNQPQLEGNTSNRPQLQCNTSNRPQLPCNLSKRPQLEGNTSNRPQLQCNTSNRPYLQGRTSIRPQLQENTSNNTQRSASLQLKDETSRRHQDPGIIQVQSNASNIPQLNPFGDVLQDDLDNGLDKSQGHYQGHLEDKNGDLTSKKKCTRPGPRRRMALKKLGINYKEWKPDTMLEQVPQAKVAGSVQNVKIPICKRVGENLIAMTYFGPFAKREEGQTQRPRPRICYIAGCSTLTYPLKAHILSKHMPAIFDQQCPATTEVSRKRYECLSLMAKKLFGPSGELQDVVDYINGYNLVGPSWRVLSEDVGAMEALCLLQGWHLPEAFTLHPINSLACLTHWHCLMIMANHFTWDYMLFLCKLFRYEPEDQTIGKQVCEQLKHEAAGHDVSIQEKENTAAVKQNSSTKVKDKTQGKGKTETSKQDSCTPKKCNPETAGVSSCSKVKNKTESEDQHNFAQVSDKPEAVKKRGGSIQQMDRIETLKPESFTQREDKTNTENQDNCDQVKNKTKLSQKDSFSQEKHKTETEKQDNCEQKKNKTISAKHDNSSQAKDQTENKTESAKHVNSSQAKDQTESEKQDTCIQVKSSSDTAKQDSWDQVKIKTEIEQHDRFTEVKIESENDMDCDRSSQVHVKADTEKITLNQAKLSDKHENDTLEISSHVEDNLDTDKEEEELVNSKGHLGDVLQDDLANGLDRSQGHYQGHLEDNNGDHPDNGHDDSVIDPQDESIYDIEDDLQSWKPLVYAFDSHFQLQNLSQALELEAVSVQDAIEKLPMAEQEDYVLEVSSGIAAFCDPAAYPELEVIDRLVFDGYSVIFGVAPELCISGNGIEQLQGLLDQPGVVGLGEVGLDHSVLPTHRWYEQEQQLKKLVSLLKPEHVLVLLVRGPKEDQTGTYAYLRCLDILQDCCLNRNQHIQIHCYTGNQETVEKWLLIFPFTFFSFCGVVADFNEEQKVGLKAVPVNRLLLESYAPFFPITEEYAVSAPHMLDRVAKLVAEVRQDSSIEELLEITESNARLFLETSC